MAKLKAGAQLGIWTLKPDPTSGGALKSGPTQVWWASDAHGQTGVLKFCADPAKGPTPKAASYSRQRSSKNLT